MRASLAVLLLTLALVVSASACDDPLSTTPTPPVGPPQLSCPANLTVAGVAGPTAVPYTAPVEKDGAPPVTVTCSPVSGSTFAVGTTAVTCGAKDNIARTAACTFNVTLAPLKLGAVKFMAFGDSLTAGENGIDKGTPDQFVNPTATCAQFSQSSSSAFTQGARPQFLDQPHSYPTDLETMLRAQFPAQQLTVINDGIPGESAASGANRFSCSLNADQPGAVLILEGINELLLADFSPSQSLIDTIKTSLASDVTTARFLVQYVFVASLLPERKCTPDGDACRGDVSNDVVISNANTQIASTVRAKGAVYVDAYSAFLRQDPTLLTLVGNDGLHLTPAGYTALAQAFQAAILAAIPQTAGTRGPALDVYAEKPAR